MLTSTNPVTPPPTIAALAVELHVVPMFPAGAGNVGANAFARLTRYENDANGVPQIYGQPITFSVADVFADTDANDQALLTAIYSALQAWITAKGL
jgi:hypothetical protein